MACLARFDVKDPYALSWVQIRGAKLVKEIDEKTHHGLRGAIEEGLAAGESPAVIARRLRSMIGLLQRDVRAVDNFRGRLRAQGYYGPEMVEKMGERYAERLLRRRCMTIARTETARAANWGVHMLWSEAQRNGELPDDAKRVWIATHDDRVRDEHLWMDGQVVGLDESFKKEDGTEIEPGEEVNCRCSQGIAAPEDIEAANAEPEPESESPIEIEAQPMLVPEIEEEEEPIQERLPGIDESFFMPEPSPIERSLENGRITSDEELNVSIQTVHKVMITDDASGEEYLAYWKPDTMTHGGWSTPFYESGGTQGDREVLAYQVDRLLGLNIVPPTVWHDYNGAVGTAQLGVEGETVAYKGIDTVLADASRDDLVNMSLFDVLIGNNDRHDGNGIFDESTGRLWAIDNGLSFFAGHYGSLARVRDAITNDYWTSGQGQKLTTDEQRTWIDRLTDPRLMKLINDAEGINDEAKRAARDRIQLLLDAVRHNNLRSLFLGTRTHF